MASGHSGSNLGLMDFNKNVPPGWALGLAWYPISTYIARLQLWYRLTDLDPESIGAMIASRLQGDLFAVAMNLEVVRQTGFDAMGNPVLETHKGDQALALTARPDDPQTGVPAQPGGVASLIQILKTDYGMHQQDESTAKLDQFFEYR